MVFPVNVPILTLEIQSVVMSDAEPTPMPPDADQSVIMLMDLGYTKLWQIYKITTN